MFESIDANTGSSATYSDDEKHRYTLHWNMQPHTIGPFPIFVLLNPSTATHEKLDPTLTRAKNFAESLGYHCFRVVNIFSYRATSPKDMMSAENPEGGDDNNVAIWTNADLADKIILGWGTHGKFNNRADKVIEMLREKLPDKPLYCLGINKDGSPKHPLYLRADSELIEWDNN